MSFPSSLRDFGPPVYAIPRIQVINYILSEIQLRSLNSSPVTILPAVPEIAYQHEGLFVYREIGTAYGNLGVTQLRVQQGTLTNIYAITATEVLGGVGPFSLFPITSIPLDTIKSNTIDNRNLQIRVTNTTANYTGGSGRVMLTLFYRSWSNGAIYPIG